MAPQTLSMNPSSIKTRFTLRFLRALNRLKQHRLNSSSSSSPKEIFRGYRGVKMASDASMAYAVGARRAWSRAMIRKIRMRRRRRRRRRRRSSGGLRRRGDHHRKRSAAGREMGFGKFGELRNLVPGGEAMGLYKLLGETAHYIKCLTTQVQVMGNVVDLCSTLE